MDGHEYFMLDGTDESSAEELNSVEFNFIEPGEEESHSQVTKQTKRAEWCDQSAKYLIYLYKKHGQSVGKAKTFSTYNKLWEFIAQEFKKKEYFVTPNQVKQKWDALARSYKDTITNNRKIGQKRKSCPFETELQEIFLRKRNVFPEFLASSTKQWDRPSLTNTTENNTVSPVEIIDHVDVEDPLSSMISTSAASTSNTSAPSPSGIQSRRKKIGKSPLKNFRDMMAKQHTERMAAIMERNDNLKKYQEEKLALLKAKEANRHEECLLLIEALINNNN